MKIIGIGGLDNMYSLQNGSEQVDRHDFIGIETHLPGDALANAKIECCGGAVARRAGAVAPRSATEETVMGVFRELLDGAEFGVFDNFFDLGGHSLMAARLMSRLHAASGFSLPLRNVFERPTVAGLAEIIDGLAWLEKSKAPAAGGGVREEIVLCGS